MGGGDRSNPRLTHTEIGSYTPPHPFPHTPLSLLISHIPPPPPPHTHTHTHTHHTTRSTLAPCNAHILSSPQPLTTPSRTHPLRAWWTPLRRRRLSSSPLCGGRWGASSPASFFSSEGMSSGEFGGKRRGLYVYHTCSHVTRTRTPHPHTHTHTHTQGLLGREPFSAPVDAEHELL